MFLLGRLKLYAAGLAAFMLALLGIYFSGRRDGAAAVKADINENRLDTVRQAKEIEDEIKSLDDDSLDARARKWLRKD